jgi:hypothetical protein
MPLSRDARIVAGITLLTVPTVMYGGITLIGILTNGVAGHAPANLELNNVQWALFRAGHAHAGVWLCVVAGAPDPIGFGDVTGCRGMGGPDQRAGCSRRHLRGLFWPRILAVLPMGPILRRVELDCRRSRNRYRIDQAAEAG